MSNQPDNGLESKVATININELNAIIDKLKKKYHQYTNHPNSIYAYQYKSRIEGLEELRVEVYKKR